MTMASRGTGAPTFSPEGQVDGGGTLTEPTNNPTVGTADTQKPTDVDGNTIFLCVFNMYVLIAVNLIG